MAGTSIYSDIAKYLGFGIGAGIASVVAVYIRRLLARPKKMDVLQESVRMYQQIQKRLEFGCHDLRCGRVHLYEFHNGERFLSANQMFKLSCTAEAVQNASGIRDVLQCHLVSIYLPEVGVLFGDTEVPGVRVLQVKDPDGRTHEVHQVVEDVLNEGKLKTSMLTYGATAMYNVPVIDASGFLIGFLSAHFMDEKWSDPANVPGDIYLLAHVAYNVQSDLRGDGTPPVLSNGDAHSRRVTGAYRRITKGTRLLDPIDGGVG